MKTESLRASPERTVPAARIQFLPEDRAWIAERIQEVLASGQLTLGKYGAEFERRFAALCGTKHAIAVNSGTSALEIVLRTLDVAGRDVLVPTNTFFATAAAVVHAGGRPVLVDMDPDTFAISPEEVERSLTPATAGMVVVHIGGVVSPRITELQELARRKGIWLVEDAAHAHGSAYRGVSAGAFGVAGTFSFYPTKVMTSAEGGMIVTDDDRLDQEARIYRDQGKAGFYQNAHTRLGYNWRLSEPHAIIGLRHLERLQAMIADRQRIAAIYDEGLRGCRNLRPLRVPAGGVCNYYKYIAIIGGSGGSGGSGAGGASGASGAGGGARPDRPALKKELKERHGVSLAGEVYELGLHQQPVFREFAAAPLPVADDLCARHVCLPLFSGMEESDARHVLAALRAVIG
ncbi:MAG TPA: DegT/DnrJ/EryC1/StrS family aminotransferase [Thermoanaerobaculia bacterium]|nr:DegT/DnrJ/EryC1/StrS family aminotransferase [Thermoanaerobaculia bacterium]